MRSLFLSPWHPLPADNGSRIRINRLLQSINQRHEVHIVTFAGDHSGVGEADLVAAGLCSRAQVVERNPFTIEGRHTLAGYLAPVPRHFMAMPMDEIGRAARALANGTSYDLVIASTVAMSAVGRSIPAQARVMEEHNFMGRMMLDRYRQASTLPRRVRSWLTWRKDIAWERRSFAAYQLVTMVSQQDLDAVHAMCCATTRIEVVPNGVDIVDLPSAQTKVAGRLIYAGAITYDANLEAVRWFATKVLPLVRLHEPNAELHVTGSTDGVNLSDLSQSPGIVFTGYLPDVASYVSRSQVAVVPLVSGGGTRLKVLEAMARGTPVVSSTKGVEGLDLVAGVHCLVADDPVGMCVHVVNLLRDDDLAARIRNDAYHLTRSKYDWREIGARFVDLMDEIVAG